MPYRRPSAATGGDASQSLMAGALLTNPFATTFWSASLSVDEGSGSVVRAARRSARAARRSAGEDDPPEREVVSCVVLSPLVVAPAAFCITSVTRLTASSAASDSRLTIDVAVTEVGVVSVARWRPVTSAMPDGLTAILPTSSGALSFTVAVLSPEPSPVCELSDGASPSAVATAMPCPVMMAVPTPKGYCQPTDPTDITRSVHCFLLTNLKFRGARGSTGIVSAEVLVPDPATGGASISGFSLGARQPA